MDWLTDRVAWAAGWCGYNKPTILLLTGVIALMMTVVILNLHRLVLRQENWVKYFGFAFGFFGGQYLVQAVASWAGSQGLGSDPAWKDFIEKAPLLAHTVGSVGNNLCFLAAGRSLLGKEKHFPHLAFALATLTVIASFSSSSWAFRLPDALFSAYCLLVVGIGIFINFKQKHPGLALSILAGAILYGIVNLAYAIVPVVMQGLIWPELPNAVLTYLGLEPSANPKPVLDALDALVFALAFVMKNVLFLGGFLLMVKLLLVLSPGVARELIEEFTYGRSDYPATIRALGKSVEADIASLCIRLPGLRDEKILWLRWWNKADRGTSGAVQESLPPADESVIGKVLRTGKEVVTADRYRDPEVRLYKAYVSDMTALVAVPIRFQGAVIGGLCFEWKKGFGYSATNLQRSRQMADLLAPLVAARRQLKSLDQITERFHALEVSESYPQGQVSLKKLVETVHDILAPLATASLVDFGFRRSWVACNDLGCGPNLPEEAGEEEMEGRMRSLAGVRDVEVDILGTPLLVRAVSIGNITVVVQRHGDPIARPGLLPDVLYHRTVASLMADAIFDAGRAELGAIMNRLQVGLNLTMVGTVEPWIETIQKAALDAGMSWVVADLLDHFLGSDEKEEFIHELRGRSCDEFASEGLIELFHLQVPFSKAWHVVRLHLRGSGAGLWIGIRRQQFGPELSFVSPWHTFLNRFAQAADSALVRIDKQRLQLEAAQMELVATRVEVGGLLVHELGHIATAFSYGAEHLEMCLPNLVPPVPLDFQARISGLRDAAEDFRKLAATIKEPVPSDGRSSVHLAEAVDKIGNFYRERFKVDGIELTIDVCRDLVVAVPLNIAYLAVSILAVNAAESIRTNGRIQIRAKELNNKIYCEVADNGPGISPQLKERIFELGFSTKPNGSGWGLAIAKRSLKRHNADLVLENWEKGSTLFTLHFPKHRE